MHSRVLLAAIIRGRKREGIAPKCIAEQPGLKKGRCIQGSLIFISRCLLSFLTKGGRREEEKRRDLNASDDVFTTLGKKKLFSFSLWGRTDGRAKIRSHCVSAAARVDNSLTHNTRRTLLALPPPLFPA